MSARGPAPGERAYRLLLRLYPADFRRRYGRAMADFHRDRLRDARARGEPAAVVWARVVADAALSAAAERLRAARAPAPRPVLTPEPEEPLMRTLLRNVGYAVRGLARAPAFTAVVLATIALGVGANAAIFSVVSGVLLRPLPYPHPERVVAFGHEPPIWLAADLDFLDYRRELRSFERLAAYTRREATLSGGEEPERVRVVRGSPDFFPALGVAPLVGRTFAPDEYRGNPPAVVVISHALWRRRFGGDPAAVGRTLTMEGIPRTVVGVMPPRFDFPEARTDVWTPMPPPVPDTAGGRTNHYLFMVGRLRPGVSVERAGAEARALARRIMRDEPQHFDPKSPLVPRIERVHDQLVGGTRPYLLALLGAVGFVLLIVCANVANLLLARGEGRRRELAVRRALGASGRRLVAQLLTESAVLAVAGGLLGLALAWGVDRALVALAPSSIPRLEEIGIDWRVLAFTLGATVITGLLIGAMPAWRASRGDLADAVKAGGGRTTGTHGGAAGARRALVVCEVALAVVMLSGAGMLLRSLWHLQRAGLGFEPRGVLTAKVSVSPREYDDARAALYYEQLTARVRALPGVRAAGASGWLPVVDAGGLWSFRPEGGDYPEGRWPGAAPQQITPGYLAAAGLPLLEGRDVTADDRADAPPVALVSRRFAETAWPGQRAVGRRFRLGGESPWTTVVGVVGDIRAHGFGDQVEPTMYFPHAQSARSAYFMPRAMALLVRVGCAPDAGGCDPRAWAGAVRGVVRALDATVPVSEVRTLEEVVATSVASRRFSTALLLAFAALALLLAGIGTYGVISYGVSRRTYEIGVRMALGAERGSVRRLVLGEGLRMCGLGLAIGLAGSVAVARGIRAMLVGVSAVDVPTLGVVCVVLLGVAAVASALPARRATGVSPTEALRGG